MKKTLSDKKPVERNVLVVNVTSSTFMRGGSLVVARTIRPLKRKSTMHMNDMYSIPKYMLYNKIDRVRMYEQALQHAINNPS